MRRMFLAIFAVVVAAAVGACVEARGPLVMRVPLSPGLSFEGLSALETLEQRDCAIGVWFEPGLRAYRVVRSLWGNFTVEAEPGAAFCARMVQGLAYRFRTVRVLQGPRPEGDAKLDALMVVALRDADLSASGGEAVAARFVVRAEITDLADQRQVWVGTSQNDFIFPVVASPVYGTPSDVGRTFSSAADLAVDRAVADLLSQFNRSQGLAARIAAWEAARRTREAPRAPASGKDAGRRKP